MPSRRESRGSGADTVRVGVDGMNSQAHEESNDGTRVASRSDVGRVRTFNEDSCGSFMRADGVRLLVVADGMGGHRGGATASREALATIAAAFEESGSRGAHDPHETLREAIERANGRVHSMSTANPELAGMGTTVVAFLLDTSGIGAVAHVGDSRAYRYRAGRLEALTTDHSVVAEMLKRGVLTAEEAAYHPRRNEILRSVGVSEQVEVEVSAVDIAAGDRILLCSDGLCGVISDSDIGEILASATSAEEAVDALVERANDFGGPDNITVELLVVSLGWQSGPRAPTAAGSGVGAELAVGTTGSSSAAGRPGAVAQFPRESGARESAIKIALLALVIAGAYWLYRSA